MTWSTVSGCVHDQCHRNACITTTASGGICLPAAHTPSQLATCLNWVGEHSEALDGANQGRREIRG
jgi:hypothetical protein